MPRQERNLTTIDGQLYARIKYKDPRTGRWRTKTQRVKTAKEGREVAAKLREKYAKITPAQLDAETMTFGDALDRFPRPLEKWFAALFREAFGVKLLRDIDYTALAAFREERLKIKHRYTGQPRAIRSTNAEVGALLRVFTFAHKRGWIARNPFNDGDSLLGKAEENQRDRIPTDDEINRLIEHAVAPRAHLRPLIFAALDTGLRKGKLFTLTKAQIDLENKLLDLGKPATKGKKHPRFVGITERLAKELEAWFAVYEVPEGEPIFGIKDDCKTSWATLCKLARVTDLHFHDLRHWYATNAILAGLPKDLVMKQTGHTQQRTFDRYFNVDEEIARRVALALDMHAGNKEP